ncbi:DUF5704 domain-containing protein [Bacillus sp. AFS040349]|uniref:DUF5704 domain-containing protein n=1 Tax=Bacillus sp. AFS040349 TaxID=2033502 RepID=UPI000BFD7CE5|nr:DUF5704 domain-containing protein [Bacillus sp. AFS040349]PGT83236.1 Ig domain-containing protein [Bacillus sp. AFS040349]
MLKKIVLIAFLFSMFLQTFPVGTPFGIPEAKAYDFSSFGNPPKSRSYSNNPDGTTYWVNYYELLTPENTSDPYGKVQASGPHWQESTDTWESLANGARAYKDQVWNQVWAWENQPIPAGGKIIKQRDITWTNGLASSIQTSFQEILNENPGYKIKEGFVYPVHYERTYPVSAADALWKMAEDERDGQSELDSQIDYDFSNIRDIDKPYGNGTRSTLWDSKALYFRTPPFERNGTTYSFNTIEDVFKPINNDTPWLTGPGFWSNWAIKEKDASKGLIYWAEEAMKDDSKGFWGRAHPVLYTPGNDPYMRNMFGHHWTMYKSEVNTSTGYWYFHWHSMVNDGNDFKVEAILEPDDICTTNPSDPSCGGGGGGGGGMCSPVISPPSAGTRQQATKMEPNTSGVIKSDSRGNEQFNVLQGIPTSESLYANAFSKEYLFQNTFTQMRGNVTYTVTVKKTYNLTWTEETSGPPDADGNPTVVKTPKSDTQVVEKKYTVVRPYSYWQIDNLEVYGLQNATMSNYALPSGSITMSPSGYTAPSVIANNSDNVNDHVYPAECNNVDLGSQGLNGGTSRPSVPSENWQSNAEGAVGKNDVKNDKVTFKGSTIMNDAKTVENGPTPTTIPDSPMSNQNVFYRSGMVISNSLLNRANTPSSGNVNYNLIKGIKGGSPKTYPINGINTVTVHTPTVIYANVSNDSAHNQRTNPDPVRKAVILDRPFTIMMPTNGQHLNIQGYGNRDYAKYINRKRVRFPFDVYHYTGGTQGTFVPANTWIDIPVSELSSAFYTPVWVDEGSYDVLFRTFAINSPTSGFTTQADANTNLANHVATDVIPIDVIGRVFDFRVTDIADYNWENVFRVSEGNYRHTGNYYWVQDKGIDGDLRGNTAPYLLPITPGSHPDYKNVSVKTGYHFKFDLKTKGNMFNQGDGIRITPTFYFVNKDGSNRREVDLYYKNENESFVQIGSAQDQEKRYVKLVDRLRNVPENEIAAAADYAFDHYSGVTATIKNRYIQDYLKDANDKTYIGQYSWMILPSTLKTHIGPSSIPPSASVDQQRAVASIHQWYGEYSLPAAVYTVPKGTNLAEVGRMEPLTDKSPVFLKDGYIIVNFNIETIKNQDTSNPFLQYIHAPLANQWKIEGYQNNRIDPYGNNFSLLDGDVVFYHGDLSSYDDFGSSVTH